MSMSFHAHSGHLFLAVRTVRARCANMVSFELLRQFDGGSLLDLPTQLTRCTWRTKVDERFACRETMKGTIKAVETSIDRLRARHNSYHLIR